MKKSGLVAALMLVAVIVGTAVFLSIKLGDVEPRPENEPIWTYTFDNRIRSIAMSSDGRYIAAGGDGGVYFFEREKNVPHWKYAANISSVAMSSDGEYLVAGNGNGIYLFRRDGNVPIWRYTAHDISSVAISSDGSHIAAGGDGRVYLFAREDNSPVWKHSVGLIPVEENRGDIGIGGMVLSANGEYLAVKVSYYSIQPLMPPVHFMDYMMYFKRTDNHPLWTYEAAEKYVTSPVISSDGGCVAFGDGSTLRLFGRIDNVPLWEYKTSGLGYFDSIGAVGISLDGEYIVIGGDDKKVTLLERGENVPRWTYTTIDPSPMGGRIRSLAMSLDGKRIVAAEYIGYVGEIPHVYFFESDDNTPLWIYRMEVENPSSVAISSDGRYAVVLTRSKLYLFGETK